MKTFVSALLFLIFGSSSLFAVGSGTGSIPVTITTSQISEGSDSEGGFDDFEVKVKPSIVGQVATYKLEFELKDRGFLDSDVSVLTFDFPKETDLSQVSVVSFEADSKERDYYLSSFSYDSTQLTLVIKKHNSKSNDDEKCKSVEFEIKLSGIVNTTKAGRYRIYATVLKENGDVLAGPTHSKSFTLHPGPFTQLLINPDYDMVIHAGDSVIFEVYKADQYSNTLGTVQAELSLTDDSDPIGEIVGAVLYVRTVGSGYVKAELEGFSVISGLITVEHGELSAIELNIETDQIVRISLYGIVDAVLLDAYGNLVTNYDLSEHPLELVLYTDLGLLSQMTISENSLLINGTIDLSETDIFYDGLTVETEMQVGSNGIMSNREPVSFSGYDIVEVLDSLGNPLTGLLGYFDSKVKVVVVNNGTIIPSSEVSLTGMLHSSDHLGVTYFTGYSDGRIDTIEVNVPGAEESVSHDSLGLVLTAHFMAEEDVFTTDMISLPVQIIQRDYITFENGSFLPDTISHAIPFDISFAILTHGISGPIESSELMIQLYDSTGSSVATIYRDTVLSTTFSEGRISYSHLQGFLESSVGGLSGFYDVYLDIRLQANGQTYTLVEPFVDSIFVLDQTNLSYKINSLQPNIMSVMAPSKVSFILVVESDSSINIDPVQSSVTLQGREFSATVNIDPNIEQLNPGENEIISQEFYIPATQLGEALTVDIRIVYTRTSDGSIVLFSSDANGETIFIQDRPVVRINSLVTDAFNGSHVNTHQPFQIVAEIENVSTKTAYDLSVLLTSDGISDFTSLATIDSLLPGEKQEISWGVIASAQSTYAEVFTVRINNDDISQLEPLDNVTLAIIESPVQLVLTHELYGVIGDLVDQQSHFVMTVEMLNLGDAQADLGQFLLTTGGVNFGSGDSLRGEIGVREHLTFEFIAPPYDTSVQFEFQLTQIPVDRNTGLPSQIDRASFSFDIRVESLASDLFAEAELLGTNLVTPGNSKRMYRLTLTNQSSTMVDDVELKEITMGLHLDDNTRPGVDEIFDSHLSLFMRDGVEVPVTFTGADVFTAHFDGITIPTGEEVELEFIPMIVPRLGQSFSLTLEAGDIIVEKTEGPQAGQRVPVATPGGNRFLISQTYITRGEGLTESFIIERNPFNPDEGEVRFGYRLDQSSSIRFSIFTLTGEEVYKKTIGINDAGGQVGEHDVSWDGRNSDGNIVYSGVYVAILEVVSTGEKARVKVAVMR